MPVECRYRTCLFNTRILSLFLNILTMKTTIITDISQAMDDLISTFSAFEQQEIDTVPFEGSWTAGQVAEHIIKSISNLPEFFSTNTAPTTDRSPDINVAPIRNLFLDFSTKMQSPDFIVPTKPHHDKAEVLQSFDTLKTHMINAASTLDLTVTCRSFEMPGLGFLTRIEWLNFFVVHTMRHTQQLKNIYQRLKD
jgi:hypothetical protein